MPWWVLVAGFVVVVLALMVGGGARTARTVCAPPPQLETHVQHVFHHSSESCVDIPLGHLNNVVGIEVIRAWIPNREPLIQRHNDRFQYSLGDCVVEVTVPPFPPCPNQEWGATNLTKWLDETLPMSCTMTRDNFIEFRHTAPFRVVVASGPRAGRTVGQLLGFLDDVDAEERPCGAYVARGGHRSDMSGPRYLDIRTQLTSQHTNGVMAQIAMRPDVPIIHFEPTHTPVRYFIPISVIPKLRVEMRVVDPQRARAGLNDRPYEFLGMCWHLTLAVYTSRRVAPRPRLRDN